jgi:hypothetical protein
MKTVLRVLLGAILGIVAWVVSFFLTVFLIGLSGRSTLLRTQYHDIVPDAIKTLVVIPCVVALGIIFRRTFHSQRTLCALAAMGLALVAESAAIVFPPGSWGLVVVPFLFGPALVAYLLDRFRSGSHRS